MYTPKEAFSQLFTSSGKVLGFDEIYVPINFVGKPKGLRDKLCKQVDTALTRLEDIEKIIEEMEMHGIYFDYYLCGIRKALRGEKE